MRNGSSAVQWVALFVSAACGSSAVPAGDLETISSALTVPPWIQQQGKATNALVKAGYLDVNLYDGWNGHRVDPTGHADSTAGIQQAMNDARDYSFATYLPPGTYLISNTLVGHETFSFANIGTPFREQQAPSLVGPSSGARPVLRLADGAAGFGSATAPKPLIHFYDLDPNCTGQGCNSWFGESASLYAAVLRDVDLELGAGNPGAIGFQFAAAQSTYVENVSVQAAGAYAGIQGGTTEVMVNIAVTGGRYGIIATQRPAITMVGVTLKAQDLAGLTYDSAAVMLAGFDIEETAAAGILNVGYTDQGITLELVDGSITVGAGPAAAIVDPFGDDMHATNVYVKAPLALLQSGKSSIPSSGGNDVIDELSHTNPIAGTRNGLTSVSYSLLSGVLGQGDVLSVRRGVSPPPADLVLRHLPGPLPWFQNAGTLDATTVGAVPDGATDDTAALQKAINQADDVFLPRGDYLISGTLQLRPNTHLFGVPGMRSQIHAPGWNPKGQFQPFIRTANTTSGATYLGDLWLALPDNIGGVDQTYLSGLDWQAGRSSVVRQVYVMVDWEGSNYTSQARKLVHLEQGGGGRWYGLQLAQTWSRMSNPGFRALYVDGTTQPVTFYGVNPEHQQASPFVEISGAANVRILGFKEEGAATRVTQSRNVMVGAHTGDTDPEIQVVNSQSVSVATFGAYDGFGSSTSSGVSFTNGTVTTSIHSADRCSLFKEGQFDASVFPHCGDGVCDGAETSANCPGDCKGGTQPPPPPAHHFTVALDVTNASTGQFTVSIAADPSNTVALSSVRVASNAGLTYQGVFSCAASGSGLVITGPPCSGGILSPWLLATSAGGIAAGAGASFGGTLFYPTRLTGGVVTATFADHTTANCSLTSSGLAWSCGN